MTHAGRAWTRAEVSLVAGVRAVTVAAMHPPLPRVTATRWTAEVLESDRPVVVDFTAAWCAPCRVLDPVLRELAAEHPGVAFVSVDVEEEVELAARHGVLSMPTLAVFRAGEEVRRVVGARPKRRLAADLGIAELAAV